MEQSEAGRSEAFLNLRRTLLALGMLADIPSGAATGNSHADEMAVGFDHWCLRVLSEHQGDLTVRQRALLNALDAYFDALSHEGDEGYWTEEAIRGGEEWADVRGLARMALESFGWRIEDPSPCDAPFVERAHGS